MIINILYIIFNLCKFLIKCSSSTLTKLELTKIEILRENWDTSNVMIRETNSFLFSSSLRKFSDCESTDYEIPENRLKRLRERSKWKKQVAIVFKRERMFSTAKKKRRSFPWNPNEEKERYTGSSAIGKIEAGCSAILQREGNGGQCVNSFSLFMSNSRGRRPSFFFDRATVLLSLFLSLFLFSSRNFTLPENWIVTEFSNRFSNGTVSSSEIGILLSL